MKPADFSQEKHIKMNVLCVKGELPDDVCQAYTIANATMQYSKMIELQEQYLDAPKEPTPTTTKDPRTIKASSVYKKLQRTLKYQTLKEEVLLNVDHTCDCCGRQFPTRSQWRQENPDMMYPLMVRWTIPVITYLSVNGLFDISVVVRDQKLFDPARYYVLCNDCKPNKFFKKG